jgi:hypothetical protein
MCKPTAGSLKDTADLPKTLGTPIYPFDQSQLKHLCARGVRVAAMDVNGDGVADIAAWITRCCGRSPSSRRCLIARCSWRPARRGCEAAQNLSTSPGFDGGT